MGIRRGTVLGLVALIAATLVPTMSAAAADGQYRLKEVQRVQVTSVDGVQLDGWISLPDTPPGVKVPVILNSTPYLSTCMAHPTSSGCFRNPEWPGWWKDGAMQEDNVFAGLGVQPIRWIRRGYALASFSLRGTGSSGGCLTFGGPAEQKDQAVLVDWLAAQSSSNGSVGMGGLSYPGGTTWQAAVQAPDALKAIVSVAPVVDGYEMFFSPQGARHLPNEVVLRSFFPQYANPSVMDDPSHLVPQLKDRVGCEPTAGTLPMVVDYATDHRSAQYWNERDLRPRLKNVGAAVLHVQGYTDWAHFWQDRSLTASLPAGTPVRELRGWWFHEFPNGLHGNKKAMIPPRAGERDWEDVVTRWMDHWLKGVGPVPPLGIDHQDQSYRWHTSAAWPPPEAKLEARPLTSSKLVLAPVFTETSQLALVYPGLGGGGSQCLPGLAGATAWPAKAETLIAGNPYLDLTITSSRPAGVLSANLYEVGPNFKCPNIATRDVHWLAGGGADLTRYRDRYNATPFPVGKPVTIRVDLSDITARIPAGHRLVLVISNSDILHIGERTAYPTVVEVHGQRSRLFLPIVAR